MLQVTLEPWKDTLLAETDGTRTGAMARCVFGRNVPGEILQFHGKAIITSDGFVMCDFTNAQGDFHPGAFVGNVADLTANITGVASHLRLTPEQCAEWFNACRAWIATDYSGRGLALPDGTA